MNGWYIMSTVVFFLYLLIELHNFSWGEKIMTCYLLPLLILFLKIKMCLILSLGFFPSREISSVRLMLFLLCLLMYWQWQLHHSGQLDKVIATYRQLEDTLQLQKYQKVIKYAHYNSVTSVITMLLVSKWSIYIHKYNVKNYYWFRIISRRNSAKILRSLPLETTSNINLKNTLHQKC